MKRGIEIHVSSTLESYDGVEAVLRGRRAHSGANARLDGGRACQPAPLAGLALPSTTAVESSSTRRCASEGADGV